MRKGWRPFNSKILTWVTFLKRRPPEVFTRVDKLAGKCARVDGVEEGMRVREAGGGFSEPDLYIHFLSLTISVIGGGHCDGVVIGGGAC